MRTYLPLGVAAVLVVAGIAFAFTLTGSPQHQRELALDRRRVDLVSQESFEIYAWYKQHGAIPVRLSKDMVRLDPVTGIPFEYRRIDGSHYQLCAVFAQPSPHEPYTQWTNHGKGRTCFRRSV